jgi:OOP family OmpA-OmpF porin
MSRLYSIIFACVMSLGLIQAAPISAMAMMTKDVVVDSNGKLVHSTFGDCVRTKWDVGTEKCKVQHMIMKMDERIIYFDFDKSVLTATEKQKLDVLADALKTHNVTKVKIVGYTDRIGTHGYNQTLSHKRADAVKHYLDSKVKLQQSKVVLRGLGETNQVKACEGVKGHNELVSCLAPNRRVEVETDYFDTTK